MRGPQESPPETFIELGGECDWVLSTMKGHGVPCVLHVRPPINVHRFDAGGLLAVCESKSSQKGRPAQPVEASEPVAASVAPRLPPPPVEPPTPVELPPELPPVPTTPPVPIEPPVPAFPPPVAPPPDVPAPPPVEVVPAPDEPPVSDDGLVVESELLHADAKKAMPKSPERKRLFLTPGNLRPHPVPAQAPPLKRGRPRFHRRSPSPIEARALPSFVRRHSAFHLIEQPIDGF